MDESEFDKVFVSYLSNLASGKPVSPEEIERVKHAFAAGMVAGMASCMIDEGRAFNHSGARAIIGVDASEQLSKTVYEVKDASANAYVTRLFHAANRKSG